MSRVISFRDLRICPGLQHFNEIELLHPSKDALVNWHLEKLGFNTNRGVVYVPNKHRDMQGNVAVGFRAVGEIDSSSPYMSSSLCSLIERILAAAQHDISLAKEMSMMLGNSINFAAQGNEEPFEEDEDEFPEELQEPDFEDVGAQIKSLEAIRDTIRGPYLNDYGNIKTPQEYQNVGAA